MRKSEVAHTLDRVVTYRNLRAAVDHARDDEGAVQVEVVRHDDRTDDTDGLAHCFFVTLKGDEAFYHFRLVGRADDILEDDKREGAEDARTWVKKGSELWLKAGSFSHFIFPTM